jgi:hypothetical protein
MKPSDRARRRTFLRGTGGTLSLLAMASHLASVADAAAPVSHSSQRGPARLQGLLREMEAKASQYWSVPRLDGALLHLLVKATQATQISG